MSIVPIELAIIFLILIVCIGIFSGLAIGLFYFTKHKKTTAQATTISDEVTTSQTSERPEYDDAAPRAATTEKKAPSEAEVIQWVKDNAGGNPYSTD